jgi:hypothetical protein
VAVYANQLTFGDAKIYLRQDGLERIATAAEHSHYGIARTELGSAFSGDTEDAYAEMWKRGWVRVVEFEDRVYAERHLDGKPVDWEILPRVEREWLEQKKVSGKLVFWNHAAFGAR